MPKPPKFYVGQAVVCVDDKGFGLDAISYPQRGRIYTVKMLDTCWGEQCIELEEIPPVRGSICTWGQDRFEPAELASEQAISELLECLEPQLA